MIKPEKEVSPKHNPQSAVIMHAGIRPVYAPIIFTVLIPFDTAVDSTAGDPQGTLAADCQGAALVHVTAQDQTAGDLTGAAGINCAASGGTGGGAACDGSCVQDTAMDIHLGA